MPRPFVENYDLIYADKDYDKDIADFASLIAPRALGDLRLVEIGAGTGNQSLRLASRVRELVALEIDGDFATLLRRKAAAANFPNLKVVTSPVSALPSASFDAASAFFHVLNYLGPDTLPEFLGDVAKCLKPGAPFVTDIWHAEATLADPPRPETRKKGPPDQPITISIEPTLDSLHRRVSLRYDIKIANAGQITRYNERLDLHLWTKAELGEAFDRAGFRQLQFWDYRLYPSAATDTSWRLWVRAYRT